MRRDGLIERLRAPDRWDGHFYGQGFGSGRDLKAPFEAADRIEALEAECEALRAALEPFAKFAERIADKHPGWDHDGCCLATFGPGENLHFAPFRQARAALGPKDRP